jgi:hypothetical protein
VVLHVVQAAVVRQAIEKGTNGVFGGHRNLTRRTIPVYDQRVILLITRRAGRPTADRRDAGPLEIATTRDNPRTWLHRAKF